MGIQTDFADSSATTSLELLKWNLKGPFFIVIFFIVWHILYVVSQCVQVTPIHVPSKFKAVALFLLKLTQFWFARSVSWRRTNKTVSRYYISESWRNKKVAIASTLWVVDNLTQLLLLLLLTSRNNCPHEQNQWLFICFYWLPTIMKIYEISN